MSKIDNLLAEEGAAAETYETPDELAEHVKASHPKPIAYIRRCALEVEEQPIDRGRLTQSVAALARDLEDLRRAAG